MLNKIIPCYVCDELTYEEFQKGYNANNIYGNSHEVTPKGYPLCFFIRHNAENLQKELEAEKQSSQKARDIAECYKQALKEIKENMRQITKYNVDIIAYNVIQQCEELLTNA